MSQPISKRMPGFAALTLGVAVAMALSAVPVLSEEHEGVDAENTGINERDRDDRHPTAFDQGNSAGDRELTAAIRRAIVDDDSLSMNGHNIKIVTVDGVVTLRGPVDSAAEKNAIEAKAKSVAGTARVESQLEVDAD